MSDRGQRDIGKIWTTNDAGEVNKLLADGWVLLKVIQTADGIEYQGVLYVLGRKWSDLLQDQPREADDYGVA